MKQKLLCGLLAAACIFSLTACSSRKDTPSSSSSPSPTPTSTATPSPTPSPSPSSAVDEMTSPSPTPLLDSLGDDVSKAASDVASAVTPAMSTDFEKIGTLDTSLVPWGPGVQQDESGRTTASDQLQAKYGGNNVFFIAPKDCGKFYLTFDEGYENGYTPAILDVLKEKNASAVFFVTLPYVKSCPELVQRMIDEGHVVGNHTNHHWDPTEVTLDQAKQDIEELHTYMQENFNYTMHLYRPPEGHFSEQTLAMVRQMGYTTVLWSFAYADWDPNKQIGYDAALERTEKYIHEGAIYLLHAVSKDNSEILPALIDEIRARGLTIAKWDLT